MTLVSSSSRLLLLLLMYVIISTDIYPPPCWSPITWTFCLTRRPQSSLLVVLVMPLDHFTHPQRIHSLTCHYAISQRSSSYSSSFNCWRCWNSILSQLIGLFCFPFFFPFPLLKKTFEIFQDSIAILVVLIVDVIIKVEEFSRTERNVRLWSQGWNVAVVSRRVYGVQSNFVPILFFLFFYFYFLKYTAFQVFRSTPSSPSSITRVRVYI